MCCYLVEYWTGTSLADHCTKVVDEVAILINSIIRSCTNYILRIGVDGERKVGLSSVELKCIDDGRELGRVIGAVVEERRVLNQSSGWLNAMVKHDQAHAGELLLVVCLAVGVCYLSLTLHWLG
jgi:hypothetical protein